MRSVASALLIVFLAVTSSAAVPRLIMPSDDGGDAVTLSAASVRVTIRGHLARTEYELTFRNRLDRVVGGDFVFPLPPDAEVSDLGLYFNGKLRHAIAVERVLAKQAYEETVHRRVDPALAEWTDSRAFRMRLYPIPALGEKRVFIACDQELVANDYLLDLRFQQKLDKFSLSIDSDGQPAITDLPLSGGNVQLLNAMLDATVTVKRDESDVALVAWSERERAWFVSAPLHVAGGERAFEPAAHVTLLWDASGSAVQQNGPRLRAFLDRFLRRQTAWTTVTVIPFHLWVDDARDTTPHDLGRVLDAIDVAGATNLAAVLEKLPAIAARTPASRLVLVTDGIHSMGDAQRLAAATNALAAIHRPLTVVNAAPHANELVLRGLAETTGGRYLDLTTTSPDAAAERAMQRPAMIELGAAFIPRVLTTAGAPRVVVASRTATRPPVIGVAGRELAVRDVDVADLVVRAWARARLRELSAPEEIADLGKRYTMLTPRTSLLVLESAWDYRMYGLDVPDEVLADEKREAAQRNLPPPVTPPPPQFQGVAAWFVKGSVVESSGGALPGVTVSLKTDGVLTNVTVTDANGRFWLGAQAVPSKFELRAELEGLQPATRAFEAVPSGGDVALTMKPAAVAESITVTAAAAPSFDENTVEVATMTRASVIGPADLQLTDDVARIGRALESAPIDRRHALVVDLVKRIASLRSTQARMHVYAMARVVAGGQKQLHLGVAEALRADDANLAVRVLTDLAEAYADDAPVVRIVARIADGWGRADVARDLLLHALEVSPREPQTWRELMLIAARDGRAGELAALRKRHQAMAHDGRMYEVDDQIEAELKRMRPGVDARLDDGAQMQVELMFDSNYAYVDLHVVEPSGEEVTWNHDRSAHGGSLSGWLTEGFGPEIYLSRGGASGKYSINVQYYSSDDAQVSRETLAHVIVLTRGRFGVKRSDYVIVLSHDRDEERTKVMDVELR